MDIITLGLAKKYTNKKIKEAVFDGAKVELDSTLTKADYAAEARAVGNKIKEVEAKIPSFDKASAGQFIAVKAVDDAGQPTEWEAIDMPKQVNANWSQNDLTQPDYVKGRTHWEENNQTVILMNGIVDGMVAAYLDGSPVFYKISDEMPTWGELTGAVAVVGAANEGTAENIVITEEMLAGGKDYSTDAVRIVTDPFPLYIALIDNAVFGEITFPQSGTYTTAGVLEDIQAAGGRISITYGSAIVHPLDEKFIPPSIARVGQIPKQMQSDWNQNDPAAPDYIRNRPFYYSETWKCVQEPIAIDGKGSSSANISLNSNNIFNGKYPGGTMHKIILGDDEYIGALDRENPYIGNGFLCPYDSFPDTGEDFCLWRESTNAVGIRTKKPIANVEMSVYVLAGGELKKIDPMYLPDGGVGYEEVAESEITITIGPGDVIDGSVADQIWEKRASAKYEVSGCRDDITYWFDCNDGTDDYLLYDGVNVIRVKRTPSGGIQFHKVKNVSTASGELVTATVTYAGEMVKVHKIDPKYLPEIPSASNQPYIIDSEAYTYGDDALAAILEGRPILVKVPNKNGSTIFSNFMPVLQYQLPSGGNNYLILFYLKDGIAENIMTAMTTGSFDGVFGVIEMMLSQSYAECPLKVSPIK